MRHCLLSDPDSYKSSTDPSCLCKSFIIENYIYSKLQTGDICKCSDITNNQKLQECAKGDLQSLILPWPVHHTLSILPILFIDAQHTIIHFSFVSHLATLTNGKCPEEHNLYPCGDGYCHQAIGDYLECGNAFSSCPKQFPVNCGTQCFTDVSLGTHLNYYLYFYMYILSGS